MKARHFEVTPSHHHHGPAECRLCFSGVEQALSLGDWRLHNSPGYYGSSNPRVLVLGFDSSAILVRASRDGGLNRSTQRSG